MIKAVQLAGLALLAGCEPPGEHTKDLIGGYQLVKHDGLRQIISADGGIAVNQVETAEAKDAMIEAIVENGAVIELDSRTGEVRMISGESN